MINDNEDISKGRANGTLCRVIGIKRKTNQTLEWENYDGKKVYTTNVSEIEYVEFEHFPKRFEQTFLEEKVSTLEKQIRHDPFNIEQSNELKKVQNELKKFIASRRFKLTPKRYYCTFYRSDIDPPDNGLSGKKESKKHERKQKIVTLQIPVNLNDATTVHKLQGVTKNTLLFITGLIPKVGSIQFFQECELAMVYF